MTRIVRYARMLVPAVMMVLAIGISPASADRSAGVPRLDWQACGSAPGVECATAKVPLDYDERGRGTTKLFLARSPATDRAHRIGSLFINFGGPGGSAADVLEALGTDLFPALNERYDIVGMDPRGVGQSEPSIDCRVNQETDGIYSQPFTTPDNLNVGALVRKDTAYVARCAALNRKILPYVSTANVARDLDLLRRAVGDRKLSYLGFSYGTLVGATYASLFPRNYRAMVLDGPVDATAYMNRPMADLAAQSSGFERALGRFFQACAANQAGCAGFGGSDPWDAFDQLVDRLNATPIPADGYAPDPRPVTGEDVLNAAIVDLYAKQFWPELAGFLADAQNGDGSGIRFLADLAYGRNDDGTFDPGTDRYFTIGAIEQRYPRDLQTYLDAGEQSFAQHDHFWWNNGYIELNYGLFPINGRDTFRGPFRIPPSAVTPLVIATTYDPATPYRGAKRLIGDLGNARLLTMRGDGHTAYGQGSPGCVDTAVEGYLNRGVLPDKGTTCTQDVPFEQPQAQATGPEAPATVAPLRVTPRGVPQIERRRHQRPFVR